MTVFLLPYQKVAKVHEGNKKETVKEAEEGITLTFLPSSFRKVF